MQTLKFTNSEGESITFGRSAPYVLRNLRGVGGNPVTALTNKAYMQNGVYLYGALDEPRVLEHSAWLVADSISEIYEMREDVARICNPRLGLGEIKYTDNSGSYRIGAMVSLKPDPEPMMNTYSQEFDIVYLCPKPDWLSFTPIQVKLVDFVGGLELPMEFPISFATRGDGLTIDYTGHNPASVLLDFRGTDAVDPVLENITTGEKIETQDLTLLTGQKLLIDTNPDAPSVVLVGTTGTRTDAWNKIKFGSTFWQLYKGENNVTFSATSGSDLECYLTYDLHYAGR